MSSRWLATAGLVVLVACTAAPPPSLTPAPSATPSPTAAPTPTASPTPTAQPIPTDPPTLPPRPTPTPGPTATLTPAPTTAAFAMTILPSEESVDGRVAIPGERVCFLMVPELGPGETISYNIAAVGATLLEVPPTHSPGGVDELCVVPAATQVDTTASVTIDSEVAGPAGSKLRHDVRTIAVVPVPDERAEVARPYFERWVAWLAANRPELGINAATTWQPSYISINIIVTHYAYWNDEWEMVINWHVMVPPSDWSNVFLRRRGVDSGYTIAYHIDSVAGNTEPQAVDPPADLIR